MGVNRRLRGLGCAVLVAFLTVGLRAQRGSMQEARELTQQVLELYSQGWYGEAIRLAERALAIHESVLGPAHRDTATALNNLAQLYHKAAAYAKAEPLYLRALAVREKVLGPEHLEVAGSLSSLANLYSAIGAYAKAELLFQRALAINEKLLGPEDPGAAYALSSLGALYLQTGAYIKAEPLFQRALAIRQHTVGPEHPSTAIALNNLASLYDATGAYAKAEPLLQAALTINESGLGPEHPQTATALNNLAMLYKGTGAHTKAGPLLQRALTIREKVLGPEHPETASSLNNLALLYDDSGVYSKGEPLFQRSLAIHEKAFGPEHPSTAISLNNLADHYRVTGVYAKAGPLYQRALAIMEKALGPEHPDTGASLESLAGLYYFTGAYGKAEPLLQRGLAIYEKALGPEHPDTAMALHNLGVSSWGAGKSTTALLALERAQRIEEKNTERFLLAGSETRKRAYMRRSESASSAFSDVSFSLSGGGRRAVALGVTRVLLYKGRVLDALSDSMARLRRAVEPEDRALLDRSAEAAQQLSTLTFQGRDKLPLETYRQRLDELVQQQERLEAELATRSAEFRQQVTPITLESVRQAIPADAVLLEWFRYMPYGPRDTEKRGKPHYVVYVLKREADPVAIEIGEAQPIETIVHDFRIALSDPNRTDVKELAEELSERLVQPLLAHLDKAERLLISPDAALNLVPFGALLDDRREYLAKRLEITYLTSGRDLLRFTAEPSSRTTSVIVADPDYGQSVGALGQADASIEPSRSGDFDRAGLIFKPLGGTAEEAKALRVLLNVNDEHLLTGVDATEARLKQVRGPRVLHVATHGFFLNDKELAAAILKPAAFVADKHIPAMGENPLLRSGLALAGANARRSGPNDDGILTAAEVAQLDLVGTQLVVLSACETGVGEVHDGEGVYGLRRALVLAGAQTQVGSLWKVADTATKDLMVEYHQRLLNGEGRSGALRAAQRTMIDSPERSHPYYWAAFVPIGNWTPLPTVH